MIAKPQYPVKRTRIADKRRDRPVLANTLYASWAFVRRVVFSIFPEFSRARSQFYFVPLTEIPFQHGTGDSIVLDRLGDGIPLDLTI